MRDNEVVVPAIVSKASIQKELEYFGFFGLPDGAIRYDYLSPGDVLRGLGSFNDKYHTDVQRHESLLEDMYRVKDCRDVSYQCFLELSQQWRSIGNRATIDVWLKSERFGQHQAGSKDIECLRQHLETQCN
ncbi:MAG: hypothetical protein SGARI_004376 [Bacillariaceae sp.]